MISITNKRSTKEEKLMDNERLGGIVNLLQEYGYLSVQDIGNMLHVSAPTVRRDLSYLEREGIVLRNHGGAIMAANGLPKPFAYRFGNMRQEKRIIAKAASDLITDGSIIYLDTSTTVLCMIDYLKGKKGISVVTNSLPAISLLYSYNIPVKCTGGDLNAESVGFIGHYAERFLENVHTDFAFMSTPAINKDGRISDYSEQETYLRKTAMDNSSNSVFLFEQKKYSLDATYTLCNVSQMKYLISNMELENAFEGINYRISENDGVWIAKR